MKAYKVTLLILDHDEVGADGIRDVIENTKYPNWCIHPEVKDIESRDIGEWDDSLPINQRDQADAEYRKLFDIN